MCIPVSWRQPVCACWEAGPEASSCDIQVYQGFRAAQVENLKHGQGSVWQFLLNCSLDEVYVWAAAIFRRDQLFGQAALEFTDPESTRHKLKSCTISSLQIPKSGFALHHP